MMESTLSADVSSLTRRQLILRDSLTFVGLTLTTIALMFLTSFLFRSFTKHRAVLAKRWLERGRVALANHQPAQAVDALQITLSYAPENRDAEFLLAQALSGAGQVEEANNYFTELWETEPGSGVLNLELARLARSRLEAQPAINFYRAAIYGTWEGDGVSRRREIRLELARYLLAQGEVEAARAELLVAAGNVSGDARVDMTIARLLEQVEDASDARRLYLRAAAENPAVRAEALAAAGEIVLRSGDFASAEPLFHDALAALPKRAPSTGNDPTRTRPEQRLQPQLEQRLALVEAAQRLTPTMDLTVEERVRRIERARKLADAELRQCEPSSPEASQTVDRLQARWLASASQISRSALLRSADQRSAAINLNEDAVLAVGQWCGSVGKADAVEDEALLMLARAHRGGAR